MKNKKFEKSISVLFQMGLLFLAIEFPIFQFDFDTSSMLTVVTLLFAILVGFFIAAATSNYLRMQTIISEEDANLISIFNLVKVLQPRETRKIGNLIDKYMISALDYDLLDYVDSTTKETNELFEAINKINPSKKYLEGLIETLHEKKGEIIIIRQEMSVLIKKIVTFRHWFILISLAVIISAILLEIRTGDIKTSLLVGLIMITLYQTLQLLNKIDSNIFLADQLAYEVPQKVFLSIGKTKYYPESVVNKKLEKSLKGESYRIGVYKDFSKSMEKKIKIVRNVK